MNKDQLKAKKLRTTEGDFMSSFAKQIAKEVIVDDNDIDRSEHAITMMTEYIRMEYDHDHSIESSKRIEKICRGFLSMENCNQKSIVNEVCAAECKLLDEAMDHMIGLNGIEMSLLFKESHFDRVRKKADKLMDICTSKKVISNGMD